MQNQHVEYLINKSEQALALLPEFPFKRYIYHHIDWNKRLIGLKGIQGTGKTSLLVSVLKQRIAQQPELKGIYLSIDDVFFTEIKLKVVLSGLYMQGYRFFSLDQLHYYPDWEEELESVVAFFPDCYIFFAATTSIPIKKNFYTVYECLGFSFREFVQQKTGHSIPFYSLTQLIHEHEVKHTIHAMLKTPDEWLDTYMDESYFPSLELLTDDVTPFLNRLVRTTIESELSSFDGIDANQSRKLVHLFHLLMAQVGEKPMITNLADRTGIHRNTVPTYLRLLELAGLVHLIYSDYEPGSQQKPELVIPVHPIFIQLLHYEVHPRLKLQLFILSSLVKRHRVKFLRNGIVEVDDQFTFVVPVPGRMRTLPETKFYYTIKPKADLSSMKEIPAWMFGLLY